MNNRTIDEVSSAIIVLDYLTIIGMLGTKPPQGFM